MSGDTVIAFRTQLDFMSADFFMWQFDVVVTFVAEYHTIVCLDVNVLSYFTVEVKAVEILTHLLIPEGAIIVRYVKPTYFRKIVKRIPTGRLGSLKKIICHKASFVGYF